jgi:energy-coupling factor transporter ATP-binding protein EcfA2
MIESVYIDNYKCFSNTEIDELQSVNLLIGENGTGKTALFGVLSFLKDLVIDEEKLDALLPSTTLTRWERRSIQTFELSIRGNGGLYEYRLEVEHDRDRDLRRINLERLIFDGNPLFEFKDGDVQLYGDDFSEGPAYPFDWGRSALATIMPRHDNKRLSWFKDRLTDIHILRIEPFLMGGESKEEATAPAPGLENFPSWYRHVSQEYPQRQLQFFEDLEQSIAGFQRLTMPSDGGETRTMKLSLRHGPEEQDAKSEATYAFGELSDGQRAIVALYAIMRFTVREDVTLCIDEPENYLSLAEIQPWLLELEMACQDEDAQTLLISHHPELIDLLALEKGLWFNRANVGPVRTHPMNVEEVGNVTVSDFVARGWVNE